jgi:hypothetical protein
MGMSLYTLLSASPAASGTGLITGWSVLSSNSQSGADSFTRRVCGSEAERPESSLAFPVSWTSPYPAMPAM